MRGECRSSGRQGKRPAEGPSQPVTSAKQTELSLWIGGNTELKTTCLNRFLLAFLRDPLTLHSGHSSRGTGGTKDLVSANRGRLLLTPSGHLELPHLLTIQRYSKERGKVWLIDGKEFPCAWMSSPWPTSDLISFSVGSEDHQMRYLADLDGL